MTPTQKQLITNLMQGMYLYHSGKKYKLYEGNKNPVRWVSNKTFTQVRHLCKLDSKGFYVISIKAIINQRGNTWVKKYYKQQRISTNKK